MSIAFRSATTNFVNHSTLVASAPVVLTKPTGIVVNDLLMCFLQCYTNGVASVYTVPSGWISRPFGWGCLAIKRANSADVAAASFSFTAGTATGTNCYDVAGVLCSYILPPLNGLIYSQSGTSSATTSPAWVDTNPWVPTLEDMPVLGFSRVQSTSVGTITAPSGWNSRAAVTTTGTGVKAAINVYDRLGSPTSPTTTNSVSVIWSNIGMLLPYYAREHGNGFLDAM